MLLVVHEDEGVLALNYSWLPTWLGINGRFKQDMEKQLKDKIVGLTMDERGLETAHRLVIDYIVERNPAIKGLYEFLDALKYVHVSGDD
jgi:hypothetical protein